MNGNINLRDFKKVALDTNIFIYYYHGSLKFTSSTDKIFIMLMKNKLKATTSLLTLTELLSFKASEDKIKELEDSFLGTPNLSLVSFDQSIARQAARIRRVYGFRLPDAIQLATAINTHAQAFITNDQALKQFREIKIILLSQV